MSKCIFLSSTAAVTSIQKMETFQVFENLLSGGTKTKETMTGVYNRVANQYDKILSTVDHKAPYYTALTALDHCPGNAGEVAVLDVGSGTGQVGEQLKDKGFKIIDGVEPSSASNDVAMQKGIYRKLHCEYFSKHPLDIPGDSYDMIVSSGSLLRGHLPYDCFYEMIRLVKKGGIICIVTRSSSFDNETVPEYRNRLLPLMHQFEMEGKWKKLKWEKIPTYHDYSEGMVVVFEKL